MTSINHPSSQFLFLYAIIQFIQIMSQSLYQFLRVAVCMQNKLLAYLEALHKLSSIIQKTTQVFWHCILDRLPQYNQILYY